MKNLISQAPKTREDSKGKVLGKAFLTEPEVGRFMRWGGGVLSLALLSSLFLSLWDLNWKSRPVIVTFAMILREARIQVKAWASDDTAKTLLARTGQLPQTKPNKNNNN